MNPIPINKDGKQAAIISHFFIIGIIIAYFINLEEKNEFGRFYIRQNLGLNVLFFLIGALLGAVKSEYVAYGFYLFFFVLWLYSFLGAINNQLSLSPFLGVFFQKIFSSKNNG